MVIATETVAVSSSKSTVERFQLSIAYFVWCHPVECLSRTIVQSGSNDIRLTLGQDGKVGTLGQVLVQQAVGVFVHPLLLQTARIGEVHSQPSLRTRQRLAQHFVSLVLGDGFVQRMQNARQCAHESMHRTARVKSRHVRKQHQTRGVLGQAAYRRIIYPTYKPIVLSVDQKQSRFDFGESNCNRYEICNLSARRLALRYLLHRHTLRCCRRQSITWRRGSLRPYIAA